MERVTRRDLLKTVAAGVGVDGAPMQLFKKLAKDGNAYVGGSFIARSGADVFNTFVLATPSGRVFTYDKDFPTTNIESSVYAGGEDDEYLKEMQRLGVTAEPAAPIRSRPDNIKDSVFPAADGVSAGVALCWEQVRYRTAKRMTRRVDLVLAASGWPFLVASRNISRTNPAAANAVLDAGESIREAPRRLSRLVGAPVIHANLVGDVWNSPGSLYADGESLLRFSGESQIVDASGKTMARRAYAEGEGLVIAEIEIGRVDPTEAIPENAWWTPEVSAQTQARWAASGAAGRSVYLNTTRSLRVRASTGE